MRRLISASLASLAIACGGRGGVLHLATTTSVDNSGLLSAVLLAFQEDSGIRIDAIAVGSGRALDILDRRDAEVAITHDPDAERRYFDQGIFGDYRKIMFNDFVIAGPAADPASVRSAPTAVDAMRRIATAGASFASRADSSGTHSRELALWRAARRRPEGARLIETGQGMAATLRIASERQAYALTDRATFSQLQRTLELAILSEGDSQLINTYAASFRQGLTGERLDQARRFLDWVSDGRGRDVIDGFLINGQPGFTPWPSTRPRKNPDDLPHGR